MAGIKITATEVAKWRRVGVYTAPQAASLLLDLPPEGDLPPIAAALAARIREHCGVEDWSPNRRATKPITVDHAQLVGFAVQAGITAALILGTKPGEMDPRREKTLLLVIRALAHMAGLTNGPFKSADVIVAQLSSMGIQRDRKPIADALKDAEDAS